MSYITYQELIIRYPSVADWAKTPAEVNSALIHYAEHELNGRFASCYTVPFEGSHPTVKDICFDLCYYNAIRTREPDRAAKFKDAVIGRIEDIKKGKEYIYTDSGTTIQPVNSGIAEIWSTVQDYQPVFSMLDVEDPYTRVDSDLLAAEENDRS